MKKPLRIGINGFGRIGRAFTRIALDNPLLEISLINTRKSTNEMLAYLLTYDSVYRTYHHPIAADQKGLALPDGRLIHTSQEDSPEKIPWEDHHVDVVLDCTGAFKSHEDLQKHLRGSVHHVLLSGPTGDKDIPHVVLGVNDEVLQEKRNTIISNASCTTNCAALLLNVIHEHLGLERGFVSTTHAYTSTQALLDNDEGDPTRSRAATLSIVPTDTGAAEALIRVMPELQDKIEGFALRVPVPTSSFVDLSCIVQKKTSVEEINAIFKRQSHKLSRYLSYTTVPLVSADYIGSPFSCTYDANYTKVLQGTFVKVCGWYDNEWGYANRLVDCMTTL